MAWDKERALAAAEEAPSLSALLEQEGFYKEGALKWLEPTHIAKFVDAIDAVEAQKLRRFAEEWIYTSDPSSTTGFPLLDKLCVLERGELLIARLAVFEPDWIGSWFKSRFKGGIVLFDELTIVLIRALTEDDLKSKLSKLSDEVLAGIVVGRPEFLDVLPRQRWGVVLSLALAGDYHRDKLPEELSRLGIPSNALAIIDNILGFWTDHPALLDELVTRWQGPPGSDPVTQAMREGHKRLDCVLRSPWNWDDRRGDDLWVDKIQLRVGPAIARAVSAVPDRFRLELGFSVGVRIANEHQDVTPMKVREKLQLLLGIDPEDTLVNAVFPMAKLWATLRTLSRYEERSWEHRTELIGLRAKVASLAESAPELWALSLPWILARMSARGIRSVAEAVTIGLASANEDVRRALEDACNHTSEPVRLRARGLWTLLNGIESPESELVRTLVDAAAHYIDGTPIFPHPLTPMSATWLGSTHVEKVIADGIRHATVRFASQVRDQGGHVEEALTEALVKEIEVEFRNVQPRLTLGGTNTSRSPVPILSVRQRPFSKQTEEPVYGCDIAWIVNAFVQNRYEGTWVDLVQVKKSSALQRNMKRRIRDSWKIDCKQLQNILRWSASATYWLIASSGEVLVVPAKHLEGIRRGLEKNKSTFTSFTVGYNEVRSAAIPLEQYLVDLLIGQWIGTTSEEVVKFALGENSNIRPRIVVEVTISVGGEEPIVQLG